MSDTISPPLTGTERRKLLVEFNETHRDYPTAKLLHNLFEEQVEKTPSGVALSFRDQRLSYRDLQDRAERLANRLRHLGVRADTLVGICTERSVEMVVGLLGILKAGGAYVPLAPDYPKRDLSFMLRDSQVSVLLTQTQVAGRPASLQCTSDLLGRRLGAERFRALAGQPGDRVSKRSRYMIYTSGSTGKPKGALNTHAGISQPIVLDAGEVWTQGL